MIWQKLVRNLGVICLFACPVFANLSHAFDADEFNFPEKDESAPFNESSLPEDNNPAPESMLDDDPQSPELLGHQLLLLQKIQRLEKEIQELRGQMEIQAHQWILLKDELAYLHLKIEKSQEPAPSIKAQPDENAAPNPSLRPGDENSEGLDLSSMPSNAEGKHENPADEQISYLAAYELIKKSAFDDALTAMQHFIKIYPQGGYTANALYWLGELHLKKQEPKAAIEYFTQVLKEYPQSNKAPASLLKLGYAQDQAHLKPEAIKNLQDVLRKYPDTEIARLAAKKLDLMKTSQKP